MALGMTSTILASLKAQREAAIDKVERVTVVMVQRKEKGSEDSDAIESSNRVVDTDPGPEERAINRSSQRLTQENQTYMKIKESLVA